MCQKISAMSFAQKEGNASWSQAQWKILGTVVNVNRQKGSKRKRHARACGN